MNETTTQFLPFLDRQEDNRATWNGLAIIVQANILAPLTLLSMDYFQGGDWQLAACVGCFFGVLIPVLSAQTVKLGILTFFFSVIVHLLIIAINFLG
jgi:VIT1/CCC1 family predicted Fe2+/Mn2+ transporter